jgi:hypothetical protein
MADQLYLSYWLRNASDPSLLRHYEKLLRLFPFSQLSKQASTLKVIAVDYNEPVLVEIPYAPPVPVDSILAICRDFQNADCCYRLETWWDLWHFTDDWKIEPTRVVLSGFGPDFDPGPSDADAGCAIEIEFGIDANFLPQPDLPNSASMIQSNIKSLLKLVHDLDDALPVDKRLLWSESGENFSEKLHHALLAVG